MLNHYNIPNTANGINQKLDALKGDNKIATKLQYKGYYLGHVRNAADHGVDRDINAPWDISNETGFEFVLLTCSFIKAYYEYMNNVFEL